MESLGKKQLRVEEELLGIRNELAQSGEEATQARAAGTAALKELRELDLSEVARLEETMTRSLGEKNLRASSTY